jgi:LuxR family maltose regulon positive regulatory protein
MDSVRVERLVLRMSVARYRGDFGTTMALHQEVLPHLPQAPLWLRAIAAQNVGYIQLRYGDIAAGLTALEEVAVLDDPSTIYMALASWTTLGRAYARRGSLSRALETTTQAQKLVARAAGVRLPLAGLPDVTAGEILVEQNELDLAEQAIREGLNLLLGTVAHTHIIPGYVALARVRAARGDLSHALETLHEGEMLLQERQVANHPILRLLSLYRARLLIRLGRLDEADRLINQTTDNRDLAVFHLLTEARLLLRQTAHTGSTDSLNRLKILLDEELATAEANGWTRDVIEILILRSLTQAIADRPEAANADLIHALTLTGPERYIRLFLDEGEPLRRLLQQVNPTSTSPELLTELRAAFIGQNHESRQDATSLGRERVEVVSPPAGPASTNTAALIEPLTDREIELLQLVAAGQSNQEIAQQLFLAVGTVKKHLNNIFGKLGVSSRTQAAARARELELL